MSVTNLIHDATILAISILCSLSQTNFSRLLLEPRESLTTLVDHPTKKKKVKEEDILLGALKVKRDPTLAQLCVHCEAVSSW